MSSSSAPQLPPTFHRLAWSNLAAQSAEQIALAAAPLAAVLLLGAGEGLTGLLQTAVTLPFLLFALPAGLAADRMPRRWLMAAAELLRAVALVTVVGLILAGQITVTALALLGLLSACGTVAFSVAAPALVPALVPPAAFAAANARIELARTSALAAGPALGGALVGFTGPAVAFALAAGLSLAAASLLAGIEEPVRAPVPHREIRRDLAAGLAFVFGHALLRPVFVTQIVFGTSLFVIQAVFVPYALRHLGASPGAVGVILAMYGIGMMVGALLATRVLARLPFGVVVGLGPVSGFAASAVLAATIWWPSPWLAAAGFFVFGAGPILWVITTTTLRQAVTPAAMLGRVSAINILSWGTRPLGAALGGLVGARYGAEACLLLAVAGFAIQAIYLLLSPAVALATQPTGPQGATRGGATGV
jgi:predicted MFS family arabinose efflux permease